MKISTPASRIQLVFAFAFTAFAVATLIWIGLPSSPASAAPPPGALYVGPGGADGNDCLTPATRCATITGALGKGGANAVIAVQQGTYPETIQVIQNQKLLGGWDAAFAARFPITQASMIAPAAGDPVNLAGTANFDGFHVRGSTGVGIRITGGEVVAALNTVTGTTGNGIIIQAGGLHVISGNVIAGNGGAAIQQGAGVLQSAQSTVDLINNRIERNTAGAPGSLGGGFASIAGTFRLISNTFEQNSAVRGGGVGIQPAPSEGVAVTVIERNTVARNNSGIAGSGIYAEKLSSLPITGNLVTLNTGPGSSIVISGVSSPEFRGNTVDKNHGGLQIIRSNGGLYQSNFVRENGNAGSTAAAKNGIDIRGSQGLSITANVIYSNTGNGISLADESYSIDIIVNWIRGNGLDGMVFFESYDLYLLANASINNGGSGIGIRTPTFGGDFFVHDNLLVGNQGGVGAGGGGLAVEPGNGVLLQARNNLFMQNSHPTKGSGVWLGAGVEVRGSYWTVHGNQGGSGGQGILAEPGASLILSDSIVSLNKVGLSVAGATGSFERINLFGNTTQKAPSNLSIVSEYNVDPLFVAGPYGCTYLSQIPAGQAFNSGAIDKGAPGNAALLFPGRTTRTDYQADTGLPDLGHHFLTSNSYILACGTLQPPSGDQLPQPPVNRDNPLPQNPEPTPTPRPQTPTPTPTPGSGAGGKIIHITLAVREHAPDPSWEVPEEEMPSEEPPAEIGARGRTRTGR